MLLFGGSNIDYIGTSDEKLIDGVSNIGSVSISFGGVMRNIAENLARLGNHIDFVTAIGKDSLGIKLKEALLSLGIHIHSPESDLMTGSYLAINDSNHDMALALCDNRIIETINPDYIKSLDALIKGHEYLSLDANLSKEAIDFLFKNYPQKKFIVEAISPEKVVKFKDHLSKIYLIKANSHEAEALTGKSLSPITMTEELLKKGVKNVVLSSGGDDIHIGYDQNIIEPVQVKRETEFVNTTGCGDALTSGIIDHFLRGYSLRESVEFGQLLSKLTLMSPHATTEEVKKYRHD